MKKTGWGFAPVYIVILVLLGIAVIGGGSSLIARRKAASPPATPPSSPAEAIRETKDTRTIEEETAMKKEEGTEMMMKKEEAAAAPKYQGQVLAGTRALLLDFHKADYDAALKTDKLIVLYFYANWCPICLREVPGALEPAFNGLMTDRVVGFRVNYNDNQTDDDERNLARQFGVGYQHTKVFVKNGQRILKSPEGWSRDRYASEINRALAQ